MMQRSLFKINQTLSIDDLSPLCKLYKKIQKKETIEHRIFRGKKYEKERQKLKELVK